MPDVVDAFKLDVELIKSFKIKSKKRMMLIIRKKARLSEENVKFNT